MTGYLGLTGNNADMETKGFEVCWLDGGSLGAGIKPFITVQRFSLWGQQIEDHQIHQQSNVPCSMIYSTLTNSV